MKKITKIVGIGLVGLGLLGGAAFAGSQMFPKTVEVTKEVQVPVVVEVPVEVVKEVIVEVPVEKTVEVIKEVDNKKLGTVLEYLQENYNSEDVFDVDEDELDLIVENVDFENKLVMGSEELVRQSLVSYLDDEDYFRNGNLSDYRKSDVYSLSIDEDESEIDSLDYEDKEGVVHVLAVMKAKDEDLKDKFEILVEVKFEDGEYEIQDILELNKV